MEDAYNQARRRNGVGLCLSGGGFRASLFHLGALRRLNEVGYLGHVRTISSVSGGSILAAHLAHAVKQWPGKGQPIADWDAVAAPFQEFAARNLRTLAMLSKVLPWNWFDADNAVNQLAKKYAKLNPGRLTDLPTAPDFVFCATDMVFGVSWEFSRTRVGSYRAGYLPVEEWSIAQAVAASACFPAFAPMQVKARPEEFKGAAKVEDEQTRKRLLSDLRIADGGVYDNLGLEPVIKDHGTVLVSDGGAPFDPRPDTGLISRAGRYVGIQGRQVSALRKRMLHDAYRDVDAGGEASLRGAYWGIDDHTSLPSVTGYAAHLTKRTIAEIRTDLDAFSREEMMVLENQGYLACAEALLEGKFMPKTGANVPIKAPHPGMLAEPIVKAALVNSNKRRLLGRF